METFRAIALHVYGGGFTHGLAKYFETLTHLAKNDYGEEQWNANYPNTPMIYGREKWNLSGLNRIHLTYGNPPCAPWSALGKGRGAWKDDKRLHDTLDVFKTGLQLNSKIIVTESVPGLVSKGTPLLYSICRYMLERGYEVTIFEHDSKFWGSAQQRRRVYVIASKVAVNLKNTPSLNLGITTVGDVIDDIVDEPGIYQPLKDFMLPVWRIAGERDCALTKAFDIAHPERSKGRPRFVCGRVKEDESIGCLVGNTHLHYSEPRYLGAREMMRLCGYGDDFVSWPDPPKPSAAVTLLIRAAIPAAAKRLAMILSDALEFDAQAEPIVHRINRRATNNRIANYEQKREYENMTEEVMKDGPNDWDDFLYEYFEKGREQ